MTGSGEGAFLDWLRVNRATAADLLVPIGDDAAVMRLSDGADLVVAADAIAEGAHFTSDTAPELVGRKALAVNISDFAAMGAKPRFAFATAALPAGFDDALPRRLTAGMRALADEFGILLAGGDTVSHQGGIVLSVTLVGTVRPGQAVERRGARVGDIVAVTGALGGSLPSGRHLTFVPRLRESRVLSGRFRPTAMMDVSDGLLLDLSRLCQMSGVGARVDAGLVPIHDDARQGGGDPLEHALSDGEDFELLFTMAPERFGELRATWCEPTPITAIGEIIETGLRLVRNGRDEGVEPRGFEHR